MYIPPPNLMTPHPNTHKKRINIMQNLPSKTRLLQHKYIYIPLAALIISIITIAESNIVHQTPKQPNTAIPEYSNIHHACMEIEKIQPNKDIGINPIDISMCTKEAIAYQYNNEMLKINNQTPHDMDDIKMYCHKNANKDEVNTCVDDVSFILLNKNINTPYKTTIHETTATPHTP